MREVIKTMLMSPAVLVGRRVSIEDQIAVRDDRERGSATGAEVDYAFPLAQQIAQLGEPLYRKLEPTGYSSVDAEWINSAALLARMNFALALTANRVAGVKVDVSRFTEDPGQMARLMMFTDPSAQTQAAIEKAVAQQKTAIQANSAKPTDQVRIPAPPANASVLDGTAMVESPIPRKRPQPPAANRNPGPPQPPSSTSALVAGLVLGSPDFQRR